MTGPPRDQRWGIVDIIRDFLAVHRRMRALFERARAGGLSFDEVRELVGDGDASVLYRLKERCHALFRVDEGSGPIRPREALFDLAVGSLFHEAMKFRENLYQREIYAPRVRELHTRAGAESKGLFREFEKILGAAGERMAESLAESEELLELTRVQFRLLLHDRSGDPIVPRTLVANRAACEEVFGEGFDALLADLYGSAPDGYTAAARAWLDSACFDEAREALEEAVQRSERTALLARLLDYARGMQAYLRGDYAASVESLTRWLEAGPNGDERAWVRLAAEAVSRIDQLVEGKAQEPLAVAARELARRLEGLAPAVAAG